MLDASSLKAKQAPPGFALDLVHPPNAQISRDYYRRVGGPWGWVDHLSWADTQWEAYAHHANLSTYLATVDQAPVGYCEYQTQEGGDVQLKYFGLLPEHLGRGLGGAFLSEVIKQAWQLPNIKRLWLHTCTHDHPNALGNYLKRGFEVYQTRTVNE